MQSWTYKLLKSRLFMLLHCCLCFLVAHYTVRMPRPCPHKHRTLYLSPKNRYAMQITPCPRAPAGQSTFSMHRAEDWEQLPSLATALRQLGIKVSYRIRNMAPIPARRFVFCEYSQKEWKKKKKLGMHSFTLNEFALTNRTRFPHLQLRQKKCSVHSQQGKVLGGSGEAPVPRGKCSLWKKSTYHDILVHAKCLPMLSWPWHWGSRCTPIFSGVPHFSIMSPSVSVGSPVLYRDCGLCFWSSRMLIYNQCSRNPMLWDLIWMHWLQYTPEWFLCLNSASQNTHFTSWISLGGYR